MYRKFVKPLPFQSHLSASVQPCIADRTFRPRQVVAQESSRPLTAAKPGWLPEQADCEQMVYNFRLTTRANEARVAAILKASVPNWLCRRLCVVLGVCNVSARGSDARR